MGKQMQYKHSGSSKSSSSLDSTHPDCLWRILHIKYHPSRQLKKRVTHRNSSSGRSAAGTVLPGKDDSSSADAMKEHSVVDRRNSTVEVKVAISTSAAKHSVRCQVKALIMKGTSMNRSRHHRSSTCPILSQSTHPTSTYDLEPSNIEPLAKTVEIDGSIIVSPDARKNPLATDKLDPMPFMCSEKSRTRKKRCVECGAVSTCDYLVFDLIHECQPVKEDMLFKKLKNENHDIEEDKLIQARKLTKDASTLVYKDFLDAVDIINMNKDLLLTLSRDPGSLLAHHFHHQQVSSAKIILVRSISFPLPRSSPGRRVLEAANIIKLADNGSLAKGKEQLSELFIPSVAEGRVNRMLPGMTERASNSFGSNEGRSQRSAKNFKNLKKNMKHVIRESKNGKHHITMDDILHEMLQGRGLSEEFKKIFNKLIDLTITREGKDRPAGGYGSDFSSHSLTKNCMRRTSSLKEPLDRCCQLYEIRINREVKHLYFEQLKLKTEEAHSPLRTSKSLKRILSLPDLQSLSYFFQNEVLDVLSLNTPVMVSKNFSMSLDSILYEQKSLDHYVNSKNPLLLNTPMVDTVQENFIKVGENDLVVANNVESDPDSNNVINAMVGVIIDDFGHSTFKDTATFDEWDIGPIKESKSTVMVADNDWMTADSKSNPGLPDRLDNVVEQQDTSMESLKVVNTTENFQNVEILSRYLNYGIHHFHVETKDKAEFNYVRDVLKLSGLTADESFLAWHSNGQPVDPSLYKDMESDPDFYSCEAGYYDHHLLFDLINEALLEIYGRSYCYRPIRLSSLSHIRPMPAEHHVLYEVWTRISQHLSIRSKAEQTRDDVVSKDLAKRDEWANLQSYNECVGLELEGLIFNDLLEEIFWN